MSKTFIIRADASKALGHGHVLRQQELAKYILSQAPDSTIIWAASEETFALAPHLHDIFKTVVLPDAPQSEQVDRIADFMDALGPLPPGTMIVDGHHLDHETLDRAREMGVAGASIQLDEKQDRKLGNHSAIFNFLPMDPTNYAPLVSDETEVFTGGRYQILSPLFNKLAAQREQVLANRTKKAKREVLLMNGGLNIEHMLEELIEGLSTHPKQWRDCTFKAFMISKGVNAEAAKALEASVTHARDAGVDVTFYPDCPDIPQHIKTCDLYIGAAGLTPYQLAAIGGVPSVLLAAGHNQEIIATLVGDSGAGINAGTFAELKDGRPVRNPAWTRAQTLNALDMARTILDSKSLYKTAAKASKNFCDGHGAERIGNYLLSIS